MKVSHVVLNTMGCRDCHDDKFLETALVGNADALVSGDSDLLVLRQIGSIPVLSVADFLSHFP
jgi:predicted nucleic acid-binding protein